MFCLKFTMFTQRVWATKFFSRVTMVKKVGLVNYLRFQKSGEKEEWTVRNKRRIKEEESREDRKNSTVPLLSLT